MNISLKSLFTVIFVAAAASGGQVLSQPTIPPDHFFELSGFEDSTGITQLFYRFHQRVESTGFCDGEERTYNMLYRNVYRFDTGDHSNAEFFQSYSGESCIGDHNYLIGTFHITEFPDQWLTLVAVYSDGNYLKDHNNNQINITFYIGAEDFLLSPDRDSLYIMLSQPTPALTLTFSSDPSTWPEFLNENEFVEYGDSSGFEKKLIAIHPQADSLYFAVDDEDHLYRSTDYSGRFEFADSAGRAASLHFDTDSRYMYSGFVRDRSFVIKRSDDFGSHGSWTPLTLPESINRFALMEVDRKMSGRLYLAAGQAIYKTDDYGETFSHYVSFDEDITGVYKKPGSEYLYVLTRNELLEVKHGESFTLKEMPVGIAVDGETVPEVIALHQNYPNPFNPVTRIRFDLSQPAGVRLTVYDAAGRNVRLLLDEPLNAGVHEIEFDAGGLSSGVYFYELAAEGYVQTRKMLFIK